MVPDYREEKDKILIDNLRPKKEVHTIKPYVVHCYLGRKWTISFSRQKDTSQTPLSGACILTGFLYLMDTNYEDRHLQEFG